MDLCNKLCLSSWLARGLSILHGKKFNVGRLFANFQPNMFTSARIIGTIDFYHFITLSMTLTLARGHKVRTNQNLLASFSCALYR